jgi:hypothetical protein
MKWFKSQYFTIKFFIIFILIAAIILDIKLVFMSKVNLNTTEFIK